ncbi:MAG: CDP-alcohol phosphatidyltransferase family protein [Acidimicrobiia bacterium]
MTSEDESTDRIVTIPNFVTLVRLACVPWFVWLLFANENRLGAAFLLAGLGATDWIDGYLARHLNQISSVGKLLDPTTDRIMLLVAVFSIAKDGSVPIWFAAVVLAREAVVSLIALGLGAMGARRIDVTWWGKTGTFFLMFSFPLFLASHANWALADPSRVLAWLCGIPGVAIAYYAAAGYIPIAREALVEGRAARG